MAEPEFVDPSELVRGPIRHESLSPESLDAIRAVYEVLGRFLNTTLEQFEIDLMRDSHPEREIEVWCAIAKAWLTYHEVFLGNVEQSDSVEKPLIGALIAISTGVEDTANLGVPPEVGQQLRECYEGKFET